ncbi:hypothetical protein [Parafrankia irregularis]|uniref:hypothetical protein n=1 Tax=Parafrankia irregularis TaxID=795642 RepID=UPI0013F4E8E2|nr:hypothetical protein [Parafrankia irregularis]
MVRQRSARLAEGEAAGYRQVPPQSEAANGEPLGRIAHESDFANCASADAGDPGQLHLAGLPLDKNEAASLWTEAWTRFAGEYIGDVAAGSGQGWQPRWGIGVGRAIFPIMDIDVSGAPAGGLCAMQPPAEVVAAVEEGARVRVRAGGS